MNHHRCCMYNTSLGVFGIKKINCGQFDGLSRLPSPLATGPNSVGKETQNRNKFNAVSHSLVHSLSTPLSLRLRHPRHSFFCSLPTSTKPVFPSPPFIPPTPESPMLLTSLACLVYASASALAQTQIVYDSAHNATPITGTWSSGSMNVVTGAVRMFVHLPWHLFIAGNSCSNSCMLTTRASHTPKLQVFLLHCASISPSISARVEDIEVLFHFFF